MVVVILIDGLENIFDVVGPFDTAELASKWVGEMHDAEFAQVGTRFEIEHVSKPLISREDNMDIDDVIKFLCDHNIRLIEINQDKNEATITERYGSVTTFEIDTDCGHDMDIRECEEDPYSCVECTYCGSRPCVC